MEAKHDELFAEFLGFDILSNGRFQYEGEIITSLPYFISDWNWIMKIVIQIKSLNIEDYHLVDDIDDALMSVDIEMVYLNCANLLYHYNKQIKI